MLSAKTVAQKPSGRVMPAESPSQRVAAAWAGTVADHDISISPATRRPRPPEPRSIEFVDDKYVHGIVNLSFRLRQIFTSGGFRLIPPAFGRPCSAVPPSLLGRAGRGPCAAGQR